MTIELKNKQDTVEKLHGKQLKIVHKLIGKLTY